MLFIGFGRVVFVNIRRTEQPIPVYWPCALMPGLLEIHPTGKTYCEERRACSEWEYSLSLSRQSMLAISPDRSPVEKIIPF